MSALTYNDKYIFGKSELTTLPSQKVMKAATLADVAKLAGVSAKTVSRVINANDYVSEETRARVESAIEKLGYSPNRAARSLASNSNTVIGLVLPDISNAYFSEVIAGVECVAQEHQYSVLLLNSGSEPERERDAFRILEEHRVDGLILNTPVLQENELRTLVQRQRAMVMIGHDPIGDHAGIVNVDVRSAMAEAVEYLVKSGRRNIAYVKPNPDNRFPHRERLVGLQDAARRFQLDVSPILIDQAGRSFEGTSANVISVLSNQPEINAIICYNDETAFAVLDACDRQGLRVPDDVSIIGFDDVMYSRLQRISLTTFHIPRYDVGVTAGKMLFDRMAGNLDSQEVLLRPTFIKRLSTPDISAERPD